MGIIKPVNEHTEWIYTLLILEKLNGYLYICLDPFNLNKAIKREYFQLPIAEEIFADMNSAKYFFKIDAIAFVKVLWIRIVQNYSPLVVIDLLVYLKEYIVQMKYFRF